MKKGCSALTVALLGLSACGGGSKGVASWITTFDSTGDTIVARSSGDVPNEAEKRLVLEQRIGEAEGNDTVTFGRIQEIAVTRDNRVFVYDGQGPSLKLFDSTGKLLRFVGRKGAGPGEFDQVTGAGMLPNDNLAIWDASHARVNVYSAAGDYAWQWRVPVSGWFSYEGLHTDAAGDVVLRLPVGGQKGRGRVPAFGYVRFDSAGVIRDTVVIPRWIDSTPSLLARGTQVVAMRELPYAPEITFTWSRSGALLSGPGAPYVVYLTNGRGRPLRIEREWTPVQVLPDESDYARAELTYAMRSVVPDWHWSGPGIPRDKPAYSGLKASEDGRIWVKLHTTAERVEAEDPPPGEPGQAPPPVRRYAEPNVFDVFEASGVYLGRVRADRSHFVMRMRGNHVWGELTDSSGVAFVARWRVEPPFQPTKPAQ